MNLGNNIKLDIPKSVFLFERGIFVSRDSLQQFLTWREKWKWAAEMTCNGYMLKHQRNCLATTLKNLSKMDD